LVCLGSKACQFTISNHHQDDTILLYKIHRSEPKLVEFNPKKGTVGPGQDVTIQLKFIDPKITLARVLTKVIEVNRSMLNADFNANWENKQHVIVKKVIEMRNGTYCLTSDLKQLAGSFITDSSHISRDIASSVVVKPLENKLIDDKYHDKLIVEGSNQVAISDIDSLSSVHKLKNSFGDDAILSTFLDTIMKTLNDSSNETNEGAKSLLMGLGLGLGTALGPHADKLQNPSERSTESRGRHVDDNDGPNMLQQSNKSFKNNYYRQIDSSSNTYTNTNTYTRKFDNIDDVSDDCDTEAEQSKQQSFDMSQCSKLSVISTSGDIVSMLLVVHGSNITNENVNDVIRVRLAESIRSSQKITAIEVSNCPRVDLIRASVTSMFYIDDSDVSSGYDDDGVLEILTMRAAILRDNLRHLTISSTSIYEIDDTINNYISLTHLDLSRNNIHMISGPFRLPHLTYVNLSHNLLESLDYIQELTSLKSLLVSSNNLASFKVSVNVLVPLSSTLTVLDMSFNPVSLSVPLMYHQFLLPSVLINRFVVI